MFKVTSKSMLSRTGEFSTQLHGSFETPNFMPVGTRASVKGVDVEKLIEIGAQITLINTYHLTLRPGAGLIKKFGGIHKFASWNKPILSDSGGFQVYSLKKLRKITEEGVEFRSYLDGSKYFFSPENAIRIQDDLGVDIAMAFDECPPADGDFETILKSWERTLRWAKRSFEARKRESMSIFGITQGGIFRELRTKSAQEIQNIPFDGYAIGGLSVGEPKDLMYEVLSYHPQQLPENKIRYLMGVGTPEDIVEAVKNGVDIFDCVIPTRAGRFGRAYVRGEKPFLNIKNSEYQEIDLPLDSTCSCLACRKYSRAYICHLFRVEEMLGPQLVSIHNLTHYMDLMRAIREAIKNDKFDVFYINEKKRWKEE